MAIKKIFQSNFLSKPHFKKGKDSALIVLGLCILASWFHWNPDVFFGNNLAANYTAVIKNGEYWRLFTTSFVHGDLKHLLSNSFMLSILIYFVSSFYGPFISIILSFLVAALTNLFVIQIYGGEVYLVGASGVVFYLWGFWMVLYMFLQRHYSLLNRILRMGAVFLILLIPNEYQPHTSYFAHYIGFAIGVFTGGIFFLINRSNLIRFEKWKIKEINEELTDLDMIALSYSENNEKDIQ